MHFNANTNLDKIKPPGIVPDGYFYIYLVIFTSSNSTAKGKIKIHNNIVMVYISISAKFFNSPVIFSGVFAHISSHLSK